MKTSRAFIKGYLAAQAQNLGITAKSISPFTEGSPEQRDWEQGWDTFVHEYIEIRNSLFLLQKSLDRDLDPDMIGA